MATTEHLRAEARGIQQEEGEYTTRVALLDWAADEIDRLRKDLDELREVNARWDKAAQPRRVCPREIGSHSDIYSYLQDRLR